MVIASWLVWLQGEATRSAEIGFSYWVAGGELSFVVCCYRFCGWRAQSNYYLSHRGATVPLVRPGPPAILPKVSPAMSDATAAADVPDSDQAQTDPEPAEVRDHKEEEPRTGRL